MKNTILTLMLVFVISSFLFTGYQCSTAEMTSAKLYIQRSEWENAKVQLQKELEKHPENAEAWYLLGRIHFEQKNYSDMLSAFKNSLKQSNQFKSEIDKVLLSVWANNLNKGVDHYNEAIRSANDSSIVHFNKAIDYLKTSIMVMPDSFPGYRILALTYYGMKDKDNAIIYLKQALERQNDVQLGRILAGIYYERAVAAKNDAVNLEGDAKAKALEVANKNFDEAIKVVENALKVAPQDPNLLAILNDSYIGSGRTQEAMESYQKAIVADPNNKFVHYNYGVLLLKNLNFEEAAEQFEAAIKLDDKFSDALYNLSATYMQWGAKMKEKAEEEVKNDKTKPINKAYEEKFRKAKYYLEKLVEISPNDIAAWETLGMANTILNFPKEAKEAFDKADSLRKAK